MFKWLLRCGAISSVWYLLTVFIVAIIHPHFNLLSQVVSELSAVGAPTRLLWVAMNVLYSLLLFGFAIGILSMTATSNKLKIIGWLFILDFAIGLFWPPMHQRQEIAAGGATISDTLHIAFTAVWAAIAIAIMILAASIFKGGFRTYTYISIVVMLVFGTITGSLSPNLNRNEPTPLIGLWELINICTFMLWVIIFSVRLIRKQSKVAKAGKSKHMRVAHAHQLS